VSGRMTGDLLNVIFFGDSICFGQGVSPHKAWVTQISTRLEEVSRNTGREVIVINPSVNGNTTRQALERMSYDVQAHGVDVLLVQFGMNDCNYWPTDRGHPRVSPDSFRANLAEIIARGRTFGAKRVFLNTNHPTLRDAEPMPFADCTFEASNHAYNELIRQVGAGEGAEVNDVERAFLDQTGNGRSGLADWLLADGLHLSEAGHDLYHEVVWPGILAAMEDGPTR
jgi:acyl-CoA thioesterase-1